MKQWQIKIAMLIEHNVLPVLFIILGVGRANDFMELAGLIISEATISSAYINFLHIATLLKLSIIILFDFLVGYALLRSRFQVKHQPDQWKEVLIPLLGTFFCFLYNLSQVNEWSEIFIVPQEMYSILLGIGVIMSLVSIMVSLLALWQLNDSFGIMVKVNKIVTKGLYRYVRHPMYCAYILNVIALFCLSPSVIYLVLGLVFITVTIYRAKLEEEKLLMYSEEYREYIKNVSFLFPIRLIR